MHEAVEEVETIALDDALNVDIAPDGTVYGIEFLNANAQLSSMDDGSLVIENQELGTQLTVPLPR